MTFRKYDEARHAAQVEANRLKRPMGIEKVNEFGQPGFSVKMIPAKAELRFGWETRVEVVEPIL